MQALRVGECLVKDSQGRWMYFSHPLVLVEAHTHAEVLSCLARVEAYAQAGLYAVGCVAYEAACGFDTHLKAKNPEPGLPLLWFAIYDKSSLVDQPEAGEVSKASFYPMQDFSAYQKRFSSVQEHIKAGDCYQVDYTFPLRCVKLGHSWDFFLARFAGLPVAFGAYLNLGCLVLASASPELFFEREGGLLRCKPMKGTRRRSACEAEDGMLREDLARHPKDRAENLMIVDMVRNDLGRIAYPGSVEANPLLSIEGYPTVWQMVSEVKARSEASLPEIFAALFPCASVVGAPKDAAMALIEGLEEWPRGCYTGCLGYVAPGGDARFAVAIRSLCARPDGTAIYSVGSGLVADSVAEEEYAECLQKAQVLGDVMPAFSLLETMLQLPDGSIWLEDLHRERLGKSARYFGFKTGNFQNPLQKGILPGETGFARLRLTNAPDGEMTWERFPLPGDPRKGNVWKVAVDRIPTEGKEEWRRHKTTCRMHYDTALERRPNADDVLLYDTQGRLLESCKANLVLEDAQGWWTPPASLPLLPGTMRERLLRDGRIKEKELRIEDLREARSLWLVNSLRGWILASLDA